MKFWGFFVFGLFVWLFVGGAFLYAYSLAGQTYEMRDLIFLVGLGGVVSAFIGIAGANGWLDKKK